MEKKLKLLPPTMPNFVRADKNYPNNPTFSISDFTKEEAEEYGELMKQAFIEHWERKQKENYFGH